MKSAHCIFSNPLHRMTEQMKDRQQQSHNLVGRCNECQRNKSLPQSNSTNTVFDVQYGRHYQICGCPAKYRSHHSALVSLADEYVLWTFRVLEAEAAAAPPAGLPARDLASASCTSRHTGPCSLTKLELQLGVEVPIISPVVTVNYSRQHNFVKLPVNFHTKFYGIFLAV